MSYSLNATTAYEGFRVAINGSAGRIEAFSPLTGFQGSGPKTIKLFDLADNMTEYRIADLKGDHGGSDDLLRDELFRGAAGPDPLKRAAGVDAGVNALMIGAAANVSIKTGTIVDIDELLGVSR